jgi:hypothetical protein
MATTSKKRHNNKARQDSRSPTQKRSRSKDRNKGTWIDLKDDVLASNKCRPSKNLEEDNQVDIKYYSEHNTDILESKKTLRSEFNYRALLPIPNRIYLLRSILQDFNKILQKEQLGFKPRGTDYSLKANTSANCSTPNARRLLVHNKYNNMCFYCGKTITSSDKTECDHVVSIISMFISIVIDKNIIFNFERVHAACNNTAKQHNITKIWNTIGTDDYPGPVKNNYAINEVQNASPVQRCILNRQWCRGYLLMEILKRLNINSPEIQKARILMIENSINDLDDSISRLSYLLGNPSIDVDAANLLLSLNV